MENDSKSWIGVSKVVFRDQIATGRESQLRPGDLRVQPDLSPRG